MSRQPYPTKGNILCQIWVHIRYYCWMILTCLRCGSRVGSRMIQDTDPTSTARPTIQTVGILRIRSITPELALV